MTPKFKVGDIIITRYNTEHRNIFEIVNVNVSFYTLIGINCNYKGTPSVSSVEDICRHLTKLERALL